LTAPFRLIVSNSIRAEMILQAQFELPNECCGLLAGTIENGAIGRVTRRLPLVNAVASPREFESEPRSMLAAEKARRREELEFLAIYHSHPSSPSIPSKTDLQRSYSPDIVNVIISLQTEPPEIRAWWLRTDGCQEADIEWVD
jgi:[CysO sulfur-carrier protein]-S-L-cysteine hydrolase